VQQLPFDSYCAIRGPRFRQRPIELIPDALRPVGFGDDEGMLPYTQPVAGGVPAAAGIFRVPGKILLSGLARHGRGAGGEFQESVEIVFLISPRSSGPTARRRWKPGVNAADTLRLGCTPIINLTAHTAEPIQMDQTKYEYRVAPDFRHRPGARGLLGGRGDVHLREDRRDGQVRTLFLVPAQHAAEGAHCSGTLTRRQAGPGTATARRVFLSLVDLVRAAGDARSGYPDGALHLLQWGPARRGCRSATKTAISTWKAARPSRALLRCASPTPTLRPAVGRDALWRLISHLSLNYLSLVEDGREALQEILRLYHGSSPQLEQQVDGITGRAQRAPLSRA
jgi:type VI secretion system protein ImpG